MKKTFLFALMAFFSFTNASFACGCCGTKAATTFSTSIGQKACQTVFSFINLDLSLLSPRASIADFNVAGPQTTCCCKKQAMGPTDDTKQATVPTANDLKSMANETGQEKIIPVSNKIELRGTEENSEPEIQPTKQKSKTSLFRVDLFRRFKIQIF